MYLDGVMTIVDTYSILSRYQRAIFTARGLAAGPHTISIEVRHERGPGTDESWMWIDAFDIENYHSPSEARAVLYNIGGLPQGLHSLTSEVTGTRNARAKGSWIWVDAFDVVP